VLGAAGPAGAAGSAAPNTPAGSLSVSLVIPAKNESANLAWVLSRIPRFVSEVILIDGHSVDDSLEVARRMRPDILIVHENGSGKGAALRTGFELATGDVIVMIDADGSMQPAEIIRFLTLTNEGFDLVKGSRFMAGGGSSDITPLRRAGNHVLVTLVNLLFGSRFSDLCYGYIAFQRKHLPALDLDADGFEIEAQIILRAVRNGLVVTEVPSHEAPRQNGESQLRTIRDGSRVLRTVLRERSRRVQRRLPEEAILDLTVTRRGWPAEVG
jgi:glycosyltransferase involved in cell wall biosynthesis